MNPLSVVRDLFVRLFRRNDSLLMQEKVTFLLNEVERINRCQRRQLLDNPAAGLAADTRQTMKSFEYQWDEFNTGSGLADDKAFLSRVESQIAVFTGVERSWFAGKRVVDIGCGAGRYTFGLLKLGAEVLACDQSQAGLRQTESLCQDFADRLTTRQIDLLRWNEEADFDLAFCFGVVHHTGNTYLAIRNVTNKIKSGGRLFLMVYGYPRNYSDFREVNAYVAMRRELALMDFNQRRHYLTKSLDAATAHGWFDAASPTINDLLTFEELSLLLSELGFTDIWRTVANRNLHVTATKGKSL